MKVLNREEEKEISKYLNKVIEVANNSTCKRAKCGSIIVKNGIVIGEGFNSPPGNLESQMRCNNLKNLYDIKVTDKTCCVHAEQRAIMDALKKNPDKIENSRLYFMRVDENGNILKARKPYCTICSKMSLDVGISEFVLWQDKGVCVYNTEEYNDLSFEFN